MNRIIVNYLRLLVTLVVGVTIVRLLLSKGDAVFSVYAFLVFGLGFGQLLREAVRISILPSFHSAFDGSFVNKDLISKVKGFIFLSCFFSFLLFVFVFFLVRNYTLELDNVDGWWMAVIARFSMSIAMLGILDVQLLAAHNSQYVRFNLIILCERVFEFLSVLLAFYYSGEDFFIYYAITLLFFSVVLVCFSRFYRSKYLEVFSCPCRVKDGIGFYRENKPAILSGASLVITNSIHYRLVIVMTGLLVSSGVSSAIAFSSQMVGYVRQVVVGMTSGLDSVMGSKKNHIDNNGQRDLISQQFFLTGFVSFFVSLFLIFWQVELFGFAGMFETSSAYNAASELFFYLLIAVFIRSCGEVLVSYLVSEGTASNLSTISFLSSLLLPAFIVSGFFTGAEIDYLGQLYVFLAVSVYLLWLPYLCRSMIPMIYSAGYICVGVIFLLAAIWVVSYEV